MWTTKCLSLILKSRVWKRKLKMLSLHFLLLLKISLLPKLLPNQQLPQMTKQNHLPLSKLHRLHSSPRFNSKFKLSNFSDKCQRQILKLTLKICRRKSKNLNWSSKLCFNSTNSKILINQQTQGSLATTLIWSCTSQAADFPAQTQISSHPNISTNKHRRRLCWSAPHKSQVRHYLSKMR